MSAPARRRAPTRSPSASAGRCASSTALALLTTMSWRCSSRPLATLTTCEGGLDADTHGVVLPRLCLALPPPPLHQHEGNHIPGNGLLPPAALSSHLWPCPTLPLGYPNTPVLHAPLTPRRAPYHARWPLGSHTHRLARVRRVSPSPGPILTWQIDVVLCARLLIAAGCCCRLSSLLSF